MSWITRCPACGTAYKVVPDQLKIAQGWLRCGQCQQVFDSTGMVLPWPDEASSSAVSSPAQDTPEAAAPRVLIDELLKQEDRSSADPVMNAVASFEEALSTFRPLPSPQLPVSGQTSPVALGVSNPPDAGVSAAPSQSPRSRVGAWGVVVLCVALALQWLWIERQALTVMQPAVGSAWQAVCRVLGCDVGLLQVRDGVVIDNSSLMPNESGFLLSWSVRNVTPQRLQMPALALTLLDAQDNALVRRVFLPVQLEAPESLPAGQMWDGQLHLVPEEGVSPAGYRLLAFYP